MKRFEKHAGRRFPPVLFGALLAIWLLLNQTVAPAEVLLGAVIAGTLTWFAAPLRPLQPTIRRPYLAAVLLARALRDIVASNLGVARIVLGLVRDREVRSGFVDIPLDVRDSHALAVLAGLVTSTPGTVWVDLAADGSRLTLHVLDLQDPREWIDWIKNRYEPLLIGIFE